MKKAIKCIDCPYYTGIQCHGHGEYWGECKLFDDKAQLLKKLFEDKEYFFTEKDCWANVRYDTDECKYFELNNYRKE